MRLRNIKNKELYVKIRKGKILLVLSGCLLLAGCQKETESEEQQTDISENFVVEADKEELTYSPKNSIQSEIMSGDFSCLTNENWEDRQKSYTIGAENDFFEWLQVDLNEDGIEDLILQEKDTVGGNLDRHIICGINMKVMHPRL